MTKNLLQTVVVAFLVSALTLVGYNQFTSNKNENTIKVEHVDSTPAQSVLFSKDEEGEFTPVDFTQTAEKVNDAVVHIKSTQTALAGNQNPYGGRGGQANPFEDDFFRQFFGTPSPQGRNRQAEPRVGTGSGVIINADGYIVTNNHVIDRYYEKIGLMPKPNRSEGGNRLYNDVQLQRLFFIKRCREIGFSQSEIRALLSMVDHEDVTCAEVHDMTTAHVAHIRQKIKDLRKLERVLTQMANECSRGNVPECPIIETLFE